MVVVDILTKSFEMHLVGIEVYIVYGDEGGLYLRWKLWGIDVPLRINIAAPHLILFLSTVH
jgi:hypothetical protein